MKKYVFVVEITESNDEFWEDLEHDNKSGCDEITASVDEAINSTFFDNKVRLVKYENPVT